jgi:hypothetical protein
LWIEESGRDSADPFLAEIPGERFMYNKNLVFRVALDEGSTQAEDGVTRTALKKIGPYPIVCGFLSSTSEPVNVEGAGARPLVAFSNAFDFESYILWVPEDPV